MISARIHRNAQFKRDPFRRFAGLALLATSLTASMAFGRCGADELALDALRASQDVDVFSLSADEVTELQASWVKAWQHREAGFIERLRGVRAVEPQIVHVSDTVLVDAPQFCAGAPAMDQDGKLTLPLLTKVEGGYRATVLGDIDLSRCDDGFQINATGALCNEARFGHLFLFGQGAASSPLSSGNLAIPEFGILAGLMWEPSYRSPWYGQVGVGLDSRATLTIGRKLKVF